MPPICAIARRPVGGVLAQKDIELPGQRVSDGPVGARGCQQDLGRGHTGACEDAVLRGEASIRVAARLNLAEACQPRAITMLGQPFGEGDHGRAGLRLAVAGLLGSDDRLVIPEPAGAGAGVRRQRVLVGLHREAPVAAARIDPRHRVAIAVRAASAVTTLPSSAIGPSPSGAASSSPPRSPGRGPRVSCSRATAG